MGFNYQQNCLCIPLKREDEIDQIRYTEVKDRGITISVLCHLFPLYRGINTDIDTGISSG